MNENNNPNINQNLNSNQIPTPMPTTPNFISDANSINQTNQFNNPVSAPIEETIPTRSTYHQFEESQNTMGQHQERVSLNSSSSINNQVQNDTNPNQNNNQEVSAIPGYTPNSMNNFNNQQNESAINSNPWQQTSSNQEIPNNMNNFNGGFNNIPPVNSNINLDEPDDTFTEPKKKSLAPVIIIILLLLIAGAGAYYYFIFDNPGKIFASYTEKILSPFTNLKETDKYNITYNVDYSLTTADEKLKQGYEILNKFALSGSIGYDKTANERTIILNYTYDGEKFPSIHMLYEMDDEVSYFYSKELYNNPIKIKTDTSSSNDISKVDISITDYNKLYSSIITVATDTLSSANYTKKYTKLNNQYVKKITLALDKSTVEKFYKGLLNSDEFMSTYSKITSSTEAEIADDINEEIANIKNVIEEVSLYVGIINNEFIMFEDNSGIDGELKIIKKDNTYSFEYSEDYTLKYQGDITINNSNTSGTSISLNLDLLDNKTNIKLNLSYQKDNTKSIDTIDITNAIEYSKLSEEDISKIIEKVLDNKAISEFIQDTGLDSYLPKSTINEA